MMEEKLDDLLERAISMGINCDNETFQKLREIPLLHLSRTMSKYLTNDKYINDALFILSNATTKRNNITKEEFLVILKFLLTKLSSLQTVEVAVESVATIIEDFSTHDSCNKEIFEIISNDFLQNIGFQSLPTKCRITGFKILIFIVSKKTIPWFTTTFLRLFLDSIDGESEPELVMHALELHLLIGTYIDNSVINPLIEDYFDSLSSYFPVVFSQPPKCSVTRDDLRQALTKCLVQPIYLNSCIPFILSRISSPSSVVKQESISVLLKIFFPDSGNSVNNLNSHIFTVVSHIRNEIIRTVSIGCEESDIFLRSCMNLLSFIGKKTHGISNSLILSWLEPITSGALSSLNSDTVVCSAYATMFHHLASSDVCCGIALGHCFLPLLLMNEQQENDNGMENFFLILSGLLTGIFDLHNTDSLHSISSTQFDVKKSLELASPNLFELSDKLIELFNNAKTTLKLIICELLSSLLSLTSWLGSWMPDIIVDKIYKKLIWVSLCEDENISKKASNCLSRIGYIEGNILNDVLLNTFDNVDPTIGGLFRLYEGLLSSSNSIALNAMESLLISSEIVIKKGLPDSDIFSLCQNALSIRSDISDDKVLQLLDITSRKDSPKSFEFLCELILKLPMNLYTEKILSILDSKRLNVLTVALLTCCEFDIFDIANFPEHWINEISKAISEENNFHLILQSISVICARIPSLYCDFLKMTKNFDYKTEYALCAAIARGLIGAGKENNDTLEDILNELIVPVFSDITYIDEITRTFLFYSNGSKKIITVLTPFIQISRRSDKVIGPNILKIAVLLFQKEIVISDSEWVIFLQFLQEGAKAEPYEELTVAILEYINCILSRIGSKDLFLNIFLKDKRLFLFVLEGIRSTNFSTRCTALQILSQVALFAVKFTTTDKENESSVKIDMIKIKNEVLHTAQVALSDPKRVVRKAAAQCRHQWYKLK